MNWKKLLESTSEAVNDHLWLRNEYLMAENRILRQQIDSRVQLTDSERKELAELGAKLGKKSLTEIATIAKPGTILAWNRKFSDQQVDTSEPRKSVGRPHVAKEIENLVVRMARENRSWGYDRIQGALNHLGYTISDQTVGNILKRQGISPAPERKKTVTWREFVRFHLDVLLVTAFFNSEIWSGCRLLISSLLGFFHFGQHRVHSVGVLLHQHVQAMLSFMVPSLDINAHVQRWVYLVMVSFRSRSIQPCTGALGNTAFEFATSYSSKPPFQDRGKVISMPEITPRQIRDRPMRHQPRLDKHQKSDYPEAA
jgi:transposase